MSRSVWRAAALLALVVVLPGSLSAQLGGLKRRAQAAVKDAVEDRLPFTPKPAPEFNDRVLEIGEARLEGLLKGFEAEAKWVKDAGREADAQTQAYERAREDYDRAQEAYGPQRERWDACAADFQKGEEAASAANQARIDKALVDMNDEELERYAEDLARRGEALTRELQAGKSDPATQKAWEDYQRELQIFVLEQQRRGMLAMAGGMAEQRRALTEDPRLEAACGKKPEAPVQPTSELNGPEGILAAKGAEAAHMTPAQYAIMRERVLYWWENDQRPPNMGFTQEEIDLLAERASDVDDAFKKMKKAKVPL